MKFEQMPLPGSIDDAIEIMNDETLLQGTRVIAHGYLDGVAMLQDAEGDAVYYVLGLAKAIYSIIYQYYEEHGDEEGDIFYEGILSEIMGL
jgi:hypothetical protein